MVVSDEQVDDLALSIGMVHEMAMYSTGWTPGHTSKTEAEKTVESLNKKLHQLECFLREKGYNVWADENSVTHEYMMNWPGLDRSSNHKDVHKY